MYMALIWSRIKRKTLYVNSFDISCMYTWYMVCSTVCSCADQGKHQSSASLAFRGNSPGTGKFPSSPVNSLHKGPVTRKMSPFDGVIMNTAVSDLDSHCGLWWHMSSHIFSGISPGNGLAPVRCQAITWSNAARLWSGSLGPETIEI